MSDEQYRRPPTADPPTEPGRESPVGWGGHGERFPGDDAGQEPSRPARPSRSSFGTTAGQGENERTQEVPLYTPPTSSGRPSAPETRAVPTAPRGTVLPETGGLRRPASPRSTAASTGSAATGSASTATGTAIGPVRRDVRPSSRGTRRRAKLTLRRIDPWSVFTTALLLSLFLGLVIIIAVLVLYGLLDAVGVLESVSDALGTVGVIDEGAEVVSAVQVLLAASVVAAVDVVLVTVLATLFAFLYNLVASMTGGIQVTLSEGD